MSKEQNPDLKRFLIRLGATTIAVLLVMYLAKAWFVDSLRSGSSPSTQTGQTGDQFGPAPSEQKPPSGKVGIISWRDAARHYGEYVTVEGTIVATHNSGKACFLNFHPDYKRYFTVVIFASAFSRFPSNPENYYSGKTVRVTGFIKEYKGKPEIVLNEPTQIVIVNQS